MNSSVINSSLPSNHSSSGSSLQLSDGLIICTIQPGGFVFLFIERSMNLVVGYPANIMVMWLVARGKSDSSTSNIFVFDLAIADELLCLMSPICFHGRYILKIFFFREYIMYFFTGIKNTSPLFLPCICLDRYVAVVHPIVFTSIKDWKIRVAISMLVAGLVIAYSLRSVPTHDSITQHYTYVGLILAGFTIMVYCNGFILWSLRKSVSGKDKMHPMKKKALRTVQIYLGIIVFHYLPVVVVSLLSQYFPGLCTTQMMLFSPKDFSSSTQPLLYISQIKQQARMLSEL